ncbi:MAG: TonB-dependent receptor [Pseudohongiellaceae bacterium]
MTKNARYLHVFWLLPLSLGALAQDPEEIVVVGVVPAGATLALEKYPYPVQRSGAGAIDSMNALSLADYMRQSFTSVSLNDAQNNPLQPDLQYRGFTASPLLGLAQGLAVYQNGVRINEPLGDAVNWDLLPQSAVASITLSGGANPLYGLNTLGGSLVIDMKDGFSFEGTSVEVSTGSFGRHTANLEAGGNDGSLAWYGNVEYFEEDGWRDQSASDALNFYGSLGWRSDASRVNLNYQYGESDLIGNGSSPVELIALNRAAIFTGPDITANSMHMLSVDFSHQVSNGISFSGNLFHRRNDTDSFNGDGSEFAVCGFTGGDGLIGGLEEDDLEELGLEDDEVCAGQFANSDALEDFLNATAMDLGEDEEFSIEGFENDELSGTGVLSDQAINNISSRSQDSTGADFQWTFNGNAFGSSGQLVLGGAWFLGESTFDAIVELTDIDPLTRITTGLGTGTFVDEEATSIDTETETFSLYATSTLDLSDTVALTLSARANKTDITLRDRSGLRPELNGDHGFDRINPAIGLTRQVADDDTLYASISRSSRAPTPIELACNEGVFDLAVQYAIENGEDPDDVDFECRLPNAFLADPPLEEVVAQSIELGARGGLGDLLYSVGLFQTTNRDDILFQTTGRQTGLFANVDKTRRKGVETSLAGQWQSLNWRVAYSLVDATFADDFDVLSPNHAAADDEGEIRVQSGDSIPGIPRHQFKLITNYRMAPGLEVGLDLVSNSDQYLRGDESNQLDTVSGYAFVNLRGRYRVSEQFELFARIDNVFDEEFETFGLLGEEPGEVEVPVIEELSIPVFLGAAPPRAGFVGFRYRF